MKSALYSVNNPLASFAGLLLFASANLSSISAAESFPRPNNAEEEAQIARLMPQVRWAAGARVATPTAVKCDGSASASGDYNEDRHNWLMKTNIGFVTIRYDAYGIPDTFKINYGGSTIWESIGLVSGQATVAVPYGPGASKIIEVVVNEGDNGNTGTAWTYSLRCAGELQLFDTNLFAPGNDVPDGGIAWITNESPPRMPNLRAEFPVPPSANSTPFVWWSLKGSLTGYGAAAVRDSFVIDPIPVEGGQPWIIGDETGEYKDPTEKRQTTLNSTFTGGRYELSAKHSNLRVLKFSILGTNPDNSSVVGIINSQTNFPWAVYMAQKETYGSVYRCVFNQFHGQLGKTGKTDAAEGLPVWGSPDGWGIMQVDKKRGTGITSTERWNWGENIAAGCRVLQGKINDASRIYSQVRTAYNTVGTHTWEEPPSHVRVSITYTDKTSSVTDVPVLEAIAIIYYNGATFKPAVAQKFPYPDGKWGSKSTPLLYRETATSGHRFTFIDNVNRYLANVVRFAVKNPNSYDNVIVPDVKSSTYQLVTP